MYVCIYTRREIFLDQVFLINPFFSSIPFGFPMKALENQIFCFQRVSKTNILKQLVNKLFV